MTKVYEPQDGIMILSLPGFTARYSDIPNLPGIAGDIGRLADRIVEYKKSKSTAGWEGNDPSISLQALEDSEEVRRFSPYKKRLLSTLWFFGGIKAALARHLSWKNDEVREWIFSMCDSDEDDEGQRMVDAIQKFTEGFEGVFSSLEEWARIQTDDRDEIEEFLEGMGETKPGCSVYYDYIFVDGEYHCFKWV